MFKRCADVAFAFCKRNAECVFNFREIRRYRNSNVIRIVSTPKEGSFASRNDRSLRNGGGAQRVRSRSRGFSPGSRADGSNDSLLRSLPRALVAPDALYISAARVARCARDAAHTCAAFTACARPRAAFAAHTWKAPVCRGASRKSNLLLVGRAAILSLHRDRRHKRNSLRAEYTGCLSSTASTFNPFFI